MVASCQQWPPSGLTTRQREVALLLGSGMSNKEIARRLGLSVGTVKQHVHTILLKTGARTRFALVALAAGSNGA
jgi:DNA-binding CsgD family transcriptional regulator